MKQDKATSTNSNDETVTSTDDCICGDNCACGNQGSCDCDGDSANCACSSGEGELCAGCHNDGAEEDGDRLSQLEAALAAARESELRSQADYQNLVRRTQDERSKLVKLAALGLVEDLLEPLDHLRLASEHLQDKGLEMVITQLWQVLETNGLKPLDILNKPFDAALMEVVDKEGNGEKVKKVVKQGYTLNGEVIRHAKVVVG